MAVQNEAPAIDDAIHLFDSVRAKVKQVCADEGATLNEFVNVAVAEKLAHYEHVDWLKRRKVPTEGSLAAARNILHSAGSQTPDAGDELPEGYVLSKLTP